MSLSPARSRQTSRAVAAPPDAARPPRPSRPTLAHLAPCLLTVASIPIHAYWAAGGQLLLPGGAVTAALPAVHAANWAVSVLLAMGAVILLALARPAGRRIPVGLLLGPIWIGAVVCVSHGLFGLVTKGLYVSGLHGAVNYPVAGWTSAQKNAAAALDLTVFEPWFLLEGVLLALAGRQFLPAAAARRRWTLTLLAGVVLTGTFGAVLAAAHLHVAVS